MDQDQTEVVTGYMHALGLESWVGQVFVVVFVTLTLNFIVRRVLAKAHAQLERTRNPWDDAVIWAMRRPLPVLVWVIGVAFAAQIVRAETAAMIFEAVEPIRDVCVIACLAWFLVRLIRQAETNIVEAKQSVGEPFDRTTLDAIAKLLRLSVLITAALVALQTLGFSVSGVLAFGGIGGIAVGFAAKDLLANFFGGPIIYCFTKTKNWARYHSVKQDVMLKILDIVERHGAEVAFPTSTVHVENAIPPAALAAQAAAAAADQAAE